MLQGARLPATARCRKAAACLFRALSSGTADPRDLERHSLSWEHLLTEDEATVRHEVRAWVRRRFVPCIAEAHRTGTFPRHLLPELAELGAFGASIRGHGCPGMSSVAQGLILQELERGDASLRSLCSAQSSLVMHAISEHGSEQQRARYLPQLAQGRLLGCFGLAESPAASGAGGAGSATVAVRDGSDYILHGTKARVTNAPIADLAIVWAEVADEDGLVRGFILERGMPGLSTPDSEGCWPLGALPVGTLAMDGVRVPGGNVLQSGAGLRAALGCLSRAREGAAWGVTGAALECFEAALAHGAHARAYGRPLAGTQLFQARLADMAVAIVSSQLMSLHYGRLRDVGQLSPLQVSLHARHNRARAREVAASARAALGDAGLADAGAVMRHLLSIEYASGGAGDTAALAVGRALTGVSAVA